MVVCVCVYVCVGGGSCMCLRQVGGGQLETIPARIPFITRSTVIEPLQFVFQFFLPINQSPKYVFLVTAKSFARPLIIPPVPLVGYCVGPTTTAYSTHFSFYPRAEDISAHHLCNRPLQQTVKRLLIVLMQERLATLGCNASFIPTTI